MKILVFLSHPAQFWFYKNIIIRLEKNQHLLKVLIKSKDVLETLVKNEGFTFENILPEGRKNTNFGIITGLIKRLFRIHRIIRKYQPDILLGSDASVAQLAWLHKKTSFITLEDDIDVIRKLSLLTFPFANAIIVPEICNVGRWSEKKTGYQGYMKLAYLNPKYFHPDINKLNKNTKKPFSLIRLSALEAHHDAGIKGINIQFLDELIGLLNKNGHVYISSEKGLPSKYDEYLLTLNVTDIHHYLYYAELLICDSQSMAVEAAMLGTPSIRYSSFAGKISVLEELEHKYKLTFGISPDNPEYLFNKLKELFSYDNLKEEFQKRRKKMLQEKIDVTAFMVWFIEKYPESARIMKEDPEYQWRFR